MTLENQPSGNALQIRGGFIVDRVHSYLCMSHLQSWFLFPLYPLTLSHFPPFSWCQDVCHLLSHVPMVHNDVTRDLGLGLLFFQHFTPTYGAYLWSACAELIGPFFFPSLFLFCKRPTYSGHVNPSQWALTEHGFMLPTPALASRVSRKFPPHLGKHFSRDGSMSISWLAR